MFSKPRLKIKSTLSFRLTLWYAGFFSFFFILAFLVFYVSMTSVFLKTMDKDLSSEVREFSSIFTSNGMDALKTAIRLEAESEGIDTMFYRILTPQGEIIDSSDMASWPKTEPDNASLKLLSKNAHYTFETLYYKEFPYKARILYAKLGPETILQVAEKMEEEAEFIKMFKNIFVLSTIFIIIIASFIGWFMSKRALQGVRKIIETTKLIGGGDFKKRVQLKNRGDEIEELAITFNDMVGRIDTLVKEMREMTDNIAHDLKSPVTGIRGIAEITLNSESSIEDYKKMAGKTIEECDRIVNMVNTMLYISETEAGVNDIVFEKVDLVSMLKNALELFSPIAEDNKTVIIMNIPKKLIITGNKEMLQRMIANILDNSLKYSPTGSQIKISLKKYNHEIVLYFKDTGIGISKDELPHIFDRFYRCDKSRSLPGNGLGLSLVNAIVHAHNGIISAESPEKNGTVFKVSLPIEQNGPKK